MKFRHNKKRNTALIYEMLVKELTKSIISEQIEKKNSISVLFKKHFSKNTVLGRENTIYKSLSESRDLDPSTFKEVLRNAKNQYEKLDKKNIFNAQTRLISEINALVGKDFWNNFVKDYQWVATSSQVLMQSVPPKKQVMLEHKLTELADAKALQKSFPKINKLTVNNFVKKFNETYKGTLTESQQHLLNKFILSAGDDGLELKATVYEEIEDLRADLRMASSRIQEKNVVENINKVLNKLDAYKGDKITKKVIFEVLQMQTLASELEK
tara:strand:+ start:294 stop:1100 length:807 start_codon:yes stop_codon:yes gene_type:complete